MATWSPLRKLLASVDDRATVTWAELDALVGGLPASAYNHPAFWKGDRSGWPGFTTVDVQVGHSVTFVRRGGQVATTRGRSGAPRRSAPMLGGDAADVVLVGCAKQKLEHAAPARELYMSALFAKSRAYAERRGGRWFVLSAKYGLVDPTAVIEPYDLALSDRPGGDRHAWGERVVAQLIAALGSASGARIEILAGNAYVDPIRDRLIDAGVTVLEPLAGLRQGERLAWFGPNAAGGALAETPTSHQVEQLVAALSDSSQARTPAELLATRGSRLRFPGLYSWWVDPDGARELERGLRSAVRPGLIYAGLAGATRSRSGRRSGNTLWGRITTMHLGGRHEFSTFRLSLGSALAAAQGEPEIDEPRLTAWMHEHLRVVAVPVDDAGALNALEDAVLSRLDPPLNLSKVGRTDLRARLTELRGTYNRKKRGAEGTITRDA